MLYRSANASGLASAMISPDGERTFGTYLGAAVELSASDLKPEHFSGYHLLHVEGYLVQNHDLLENILIQARRAGLQVALDLASYNVVEANLSFLKEMISAYVDIVFANEEEAKAFTGNEPVQALHQLGDLASVVVVKTGRNGSMVKTDGKVWEIAAKPVQVIDTTGAGDLYASGFLYGLINEMGIDKAGKLGTLLAGHVIQHIGAKIPDETWKTIRSHIAALSSI
jgi:sugar/nucleoside kinase (ribokinase family)